MKRKSKTLVITMALSMLVSVFAGCSDNNTAAPSATPTAPPGQQSGAPTAEPGDDNAEAIQNGTYKFESPVKITTVKATDSTFQYKNGETLSNNVHTRWALEELGIDLDFLWEVPGEQFGTRIRLAMTGNQDLPDVFTTQDIGLMNEMIQSGLYKDISEDYERYASDQIKEIMQAHPMMWSQVTFDDKPMAFPNFANAGNDNAVMWVRQDWLDEYGIDAPATFEELEAFMQRLLDERPSNANDGVIPLGVSLGSGGGHPNPLAGWLGESTWVFGPFGTVPYQWNLTDNDELIHGSTVPEMKGGLAVMKDWYDKGYISREAGLHDENKLAELIGQGRVGVVVAPYWMATWPVPDLENNVPGATMRPYPIPSKDGVAKARDTVFLRGGLLVREGFEHTDALFLYLNRLFAGLIKDEGSEFEFGWAEGYDYVILDDGTVSVAEDDIPGGRVGIAKYFIYEPRNPFEALQKNADRYHAYEAGTLTEEEINLLPRIDVLRASSIVVDGWEKGYYDSNHFMGASTPEMQSKGGLTTKLEGEMVTAIIYGRQSLDHFDRFVEEWNSIGGRQMTIEANEWYDSTK